MNAKHLFAAVAIIFMVPLPTSRGEITLHIDPDAQQLWFSGSATGNLQDNGAFWRATWVLGSGLTDEFLSPGIAFTPEPEIGGQLNILSDGVNPTGLSLFLAYLANEPSLDADPFELFDYSVLLPENVAYLDSLSSGSLLLTEGSGWGSITIVPEPSTSMLVVGFAGVVGLIAGARRRRIRLRLL